MALKQVIKVDGKKTIILLCDFCSIEFSRSINVWRLEKKATHFCSNSCSGKYKFTLENIKTKALENFRKHFDKIATDSEYKQTIQAKKRNTCIEKYGSETPLQSQSIRNQCKITLIERYGVSNPSYNEGINNKRKKTCKEKYGNEYQIASEQTRQKIEAIFLKKFNCVTPAKKIKKIIETDEFMIDWLKKQSDPKPRKEQIYRTFVDEEIHLVQAEKFLSDWRNNKTSLEMRTEHLLNVPFFNRKIPGTGLRYKPDFKLSNSIYLNVDGTYWHTESFRDKHYHFNLRKDFETKGMRIFQFYDTEIFNKGDIVKSIIDNATSQITNKIFARKCVIKSVKQKQANEFLNKNHLMGTIKAKHIGLFSNENNLVSLISYKRKKSAINIERFCSVIGSVVVGGFQKLLSNIEKFIIPNEYSDYKIEEIHNWVDLRYGTGTHLLDKGFIRLSESLSWKWYNGIETFNRLACRANMDDRGLSEAAHAKELGWEKQYDAGQRLYIKKINDV
jgi:tRNA splicing endonuclease